jgi:uncharacterized phage protein gp47/JayE
MPWPVPTPDAIASTAAGVYEGALQGPPDPLTGLPTVPDARSPNSVLGATTRIVGMSTYGVYMGQAAEANELWPDTAVDNLTRLAGIKGLSLDPATPASFNATLAATGALDVPVETQATGPNDLTYQTTADVSVTAAGTLTANWVCLTAGSAGTLAAGATLTLVSPIAGLSAQTATVVGDDDLTAGEDEETLDHLRARLLLKWRSDAAAGNSADWAGWTQAVLPLIQYVSVFPRWAGIGNVGIAVALSGPAAPTTAQINTITAALSDPDQCPVCAVPIVFAAPLVPVNVTLHLVPDTAANRAAAIAALGTYFLQDASIANPAIANSGIIELSRMNAAISAGDGEWGHDLIAPATDITVAAGSLPVLGSVSFV